MIRNRSLHVSFNPSGQKRFNFFSFDENTMKLKIKKILYSRTKIFYKCIFKIDLNFISNITMSD